MTYGLGSNFQEQVFDPGARFGLASWVDKEGSFWIFGGFGHNTIRCNSLNIDGGILNELWRYNGNWTRINIEYA
jgi:hypothetical protein